MNMFEKATRTQLRFPSTKGEISVEQLWTVPLRSRDNFNLNTVAQAVNEKVQETGKESFVDTSTNPNQAKYSLMLDIVKYIISVKKTEEDAAAQRAKNREEKATLLAILAKKQAGKMDAMTEEDLQKRINELSDV